MHRPLASSLVAASVVLVLACPSAASVISEDVPVPGGTAAFAQAFGIDPVPDRSLFLYEIIRLLYNAPEGRRPPAIRSTSIPASTRWAPTSCCPIATAA